MGKKVKSFFACLFILVVFCCCVFYFGWTQFKVKSGKIGIITSKTGGVSESIVKPGEFSWHWEFLIPTNAVLESYSVLPYNYERTIYGELPSSDLFNSVYGNVHDFSYSFTVSFSMAVTPEGILNLAKNNFISDQSTLDKYLSDFSNEFIQNFSTSFVNEYVMKSGETVGFASIGPEYADRMISGFMGERKASSVGISISNFNVQNIKLPDYELYREIRDSYLRNVNNIDAYGMNQNNTRKVESEKIPETSAKTAEEKTSVEKDGYSDEEIQVLFNQFMKMLGKQKE